jgi:hypothetical protein
MAVSRSRVAAGGPARGPRLAAVELHEREARGDLALALAHARAPGELGRVPQPLARRLEPVALAQGEAGGPLGDELRLAAGLGRLARLLGQQRGPGRVGLHELNCPQGQVDRCGGGAHPPRSYARVAPARMARKERTA